MVYRRNRHFLGFSWARGSRFASSRFERAFFGFLEREVNMKKLIKATTGEDKNPGSLAFAVTLRKFSRSQLP